MKKALFLFLKASFCTFAYLHASSNKTQAQVRTDGTVNTQVNQNGNVAEITGGETRGSNLFHSFQNFSVPTDNAAFFDNANAIENIFSRVTGGNISNIDGAIRANGSASLFLINPAGIIFGENASLDIGGSFFASTADSLLFEEDTEFSAVNPQTLPLLEVSIPIGLSFRDNPRNIKNFSRANNSRGLEVEPDKDLGLLGGNISFNGGIITAPGGTVSLGGISAAGEIGIGEDNSLIFPDGIAKADISFINNAEVYVIPNDVMLDPIIPIPDEIMTLPLPLLPDIELNTVSALNSTEVDLIADDVRGEITINARNVDLQSSFLTSGLVERDIPQGGEIAINATGDIYIQNTDISADAGFFQFGGNIILDSAKSIYLNNSILTTTSFGGTAGNFFIQADGLVSLEDSRLSSNAGFGIAGGNIAIDAKSILLEESDIRASSNSGTSGNISLNASNSVSISGNFTGNMGFDNDLAGDFALFLVTGFDGRIEGTGGNLEIAAKSLTLSNGGNIATNNEGVGNAGSIFIEVDDFVNLDNSFVSSTSNSQSSGNGGDINITAGSLSLTNEANINSAAQAETGNGGNINLLISEDVTLKNNSFISAQAFSNTNGGNININSRFVIAFPSRGLGNDLIASAELGTGGNITLDVKQLFGLSQRQGVDRNNFLFGIRSPFRNQANENFLSNNTNDIDVSGIIDGDLNINNLSVDPTTSLVNLPASVGDASDQISQNPCQQGVGSEFKITGKGGFPPTVFEALNSEEIQEELIETVSSQQPTGEASSISSDKSRQETVPAMGWVFNNKGKVTLTAYSTDETPNQLTEKRVLNSCMN